MKVNEYRDREHAKHMDGSALSRLTDCACFQIAGRTRGLLTTLSAWRLTQSETSVMAVT